jgi:hypothetical protein
VAIVTKAVKATEVAMKAAVEKSGSKRRSGNQETTTTEWKWQQKQMRSKQWKWQWKQ